MRSGAGESEEAGLPESDDVGSIFVDCAEDNTSDVEGADVGGGELGGEESCISTSATSCASFVCIGSVGAEGGAASVMITSWSGSCSDLESFVGAAATEDDDGAKSDANSPAAMVVESECDHVEIARAETRVSACGCAGEEPEAARSLAN